jgi:hypothetical protein
MAENQKRFSAILSLPDQDQLKVVQVSSLLFIAANFCLTLQASL